MVSYLLHEVIICHSMGVNWCAYKLLAVIYMPTPLTIVLLPALITADIYISPLLLWQLINLATYTYII